MINLKLTMTDGSRMLIKNHMAASAIEFVRIMLKPGAVQAKWVEILPGTVINTDNIRSIEEISEGHAPTAEESINNDVVEVPEEKVNETVVPEDEKIGDERKVEYAPRLPQVA